jgi:signal transduction histidine kinase
MIGNFNGQCNQDRYAYNIQRTDHVFSFCYEKNVPSKQVKFLSKIACRGYEEAFKIQKAVQNDFASFESIALHNVRKLTAAIGQKVDSIASEEDVYKSDDRIGCFRKNIENNVNQTARELLSIRKSVNQIEFEYNAIDAYRSTDVMKDSWFTEHRAHTIVVMTFYMYEQDFREKRIRLDVEKYNGCVNVDFSMARSSISQILNNAVKYCKPQSNITVNFVEDEKFVSIKFEMESLYFTNVESKSFALKGKRGSNSVGIPGDGIGLFTAALMMEHNGGKLIINSNENTRYQSSGKSYSTNEFTLVFQRKVPVKLGNAAR